MDRDRTAARSRRPSTSDERISWPFDPGFPSSEPQRTPPKGVLLRPPRPVRRLDIARYRRSGGDATGDRADRSETRPRSAARRLAERRDEALRVLVDQDAGRVLLRDRGELVGYELRMRERFGRAWGLGWSSLLDEEGAVVENRRVGGRGDGRGRRRRPRARGGRAEPLGRPRADRVGRPGRRPHGQAAARRGAGRLRARARLAAGAAGTDAGADRGGRDARHDVRAGRLRRPRRAHRHDLAAAPRRPPPDRCSRSGKVRRARTASYEVFLRLVRAWTGRPRSSASMAGQERSRHQDELVASYTDRRKRRHRIVLRDRLVLDLCARRPAVVVAELSPEEGSSRRRPRSSAASSTPATWPAPRPASARSGGACAPRTCTPASGRRGRARTRTSIRATRTGGWRHDGEDRCTRAASAGPAHRPRRLHRGADAVAGRPRRPLLRAGAPRPGGPGRAGPRLPRRGRGAADALAPGAVELPAGRGCGPLVGRSPAPAVAARSCS